MYHPSLQSNCHVVALDEHTGALGAAEAWSFTDFRFSWWNHGSQQVSAGRRYTLVDGYGESFPHFLVFDDMGRIVGRVRASCARFAEGGSEEMPSILIDEQRDLDENVAISRRFHLIKDANACQSQQGLKEAREYLRTDVNNEVRSRVDTEVRSQFDWIGGGRRIVWSSVTQRGSTWDKLPRAYSMDIERTGLPAPPGMEDARVLFAGSGSDLYALAKKNIFHLEETGFVLDSVQPGVGVLLSRGNDALMVTYAGLDDSKYVLLLGKRRPGSQGFAWQKTSATSQFTPDFIPLENAGRPQMLIAGGKAGLQWVDMRTGQVFKRICPSGAQSSSSCGDRDTNNDYRGLVVSSVRQTAFTAHHWSDQSGRRTNSFDEIELSTGKLLRSFPGPEWATNMPLSLPMGWLEKERRFWIEGQELRTGAAMGSVTIVTIPATDGAEPHYESFGAQSHFNAFGADPEGRFFVFGRELDTIDVFAPNGILVITMGVRPDGAFAQTGDGRFACTGSACDEFRCVIGNVSRLVTDPACSAFRVKGFSIIEELARAQTVREASKTNRSE